MNVIYLKPGESYCGPHPAIVKTVLGSCVSICIYNKKLEIGGINHYLLPKSYDSDEAQNPEKYAVTAIPKLLKRMKDLGSEKKDLSIKIIGGSSINGGIKAVGDETGVGSANIKAAREILAKFGLKVETENVGGPLGRKLEFNSFTGELRFRMIEKYSPQVPTPGSSNDYIRVLIVDDSKPVRILLKKIIEKDQRFKVIGEAQDPFEAMKIRKTLRPDVITLDLNMPKMDGLTYLRQYMPIDPIPTILVTDYNLDASDIIFNALESGALDYVKKPSISDMENCVGDIHEKLIAAHKSKRLITKTSPSPIPLSNSGSKSDIPEHFLDQNIILIGASTGGTEAIKNVVTCLPKNIPPVLIVLHIPPVFSKEFAERLNTLCPFEVKEAKNMDQLISNTVYLAPGGTQMKICEVDSKMVIKITDDPPVNRFKPSVDYLFSSTSLIRYKKIIAVLLTGMGQDGARGLLTLKNKGMETIVQDEATSVVFGMPKAAIALGAANHVLPLDKIADKIMTIIKKDFYAKAAKCAY